MAKQKFVGALGERINQGIDLKERLDAEIEAASQIQEIPRDPNPPQQIRVLREFRGRLTQERSIYPGVYAVDDARLFGLAQYLLDNGFAERA